MPSIAIYQIVDLITLLSFDCDTAPIMRRTSSEMGIAGCRLDAKYLAKADSGGARHDNQEYWTRCRRCGTKLIRDIDGGREALDHEFHMAAQGTSRGDREARRP